MITLSLALEQDFLLTTSVLLQGSKVNSSMELMSDIVPIQHSTTKE